MRAWPRHVVFVNAALGLVLAVFVGVSLAVIGGPWLAVLSPIVAAAYYWISTRRYRARRQLLRRPFPDEWRQILLERVPYYARLAPEGRRHFEDDVRIFLAEQRILASKGARTDEPTRVLIAAGAAMLGFSLPDWEWSRVRDIVVYPSAFDEEYRPDGERVYSGMVHRQGPIVLSREEVLSGFGPNRAENVVLHELAHVIDFADGRADGAPPDVESVSPVPWFDIIANRLERMRAARGPLRDYAATNEAELFAVAVETFFLRPEELRRRDPTLYRMLSVWFDQDPASTNADGTYPARPKGARTADDREEPWAPSYVHSDVSDDAVAVARARVDDAALLELGFAPLGVARAVRVTDPTTQILSRVLKSADGRVLCSLTPNPRDPRFELATLFEDGSVVKTAPGLPFWRRLAAAPPLQQHPDDGLDFAFVTGAPAEVLRRHLERVHAFELARQTSAVIAESMTAHFALALRQGELCDARRPHEARIARRVALSGALLIAAAVWIPFLARIPTHPPHHSGAPPAAVLRPDHEMPSGEATRLAYLGLVVAVVVSAGAYGPLVRIARAQIAPRLTRLRPGPRKLPARELLRRAERVERCSLQHHASERDAPFPDPAGVGGDPEPREK